MANTEMNDNDFRRFDAYNKVGHVAVSYKHVVLVWGGFQGGYVHDEINTYCPTNVVWMYNPLTEIWNALKTTGDMPKNNSGSTGLTHDGYLYIFGGMEQIDEELIRYTNSIFRLNLSSFVWEHLKPSGEQPLPCDKGTGWVYNNKYIVSFTGRGKWFSYVDAIRPKLFLYLFGLTINPSLSICQVYPASVNKLYFFGGYGQKPTNSSWYGGDSIRTERFSYVADWSGSRPGLKGWNNQLICYDPATNAWSWFPTRGKSPPPRAASDADINENKVFLFGGRLNANRNNDLYVLDMTTKQWSHNLTLEVPGIVPFGVSWHSFKMVKPNTFILFGGLLESGSPACSWWILEIDSHSKLCWKEREMPVPLSWHRAVFCDSTQELIIIGGVCVSPYEMVSSDHANLHIVVQLEPPSLFRECLEQLTLDESVKETVKSDEGVEIIPSDIKAILCQRFSQGRVNKIRLTV